MSERRRAARAVAATLAASSLFGFGCMLRPAPDDAYYRLDAGPPARVLTAPALAGALEVGALRADPLTSGRAILYRESHSQTRLFRHAYSYWSDAPAAMIQLELARYLRDARVAEQVVTPGLRTAGDYLVTGYVHRLERVDGSDPSVLIELELALVHRESRAMVLQKTYREGAESESNRVRDAVDAFGSALASLFAKILTDLEGVAL